MKDELKEVFQTKLKNHESPVDSNIWQGVQQQMGFNSAATTSSTAKGLLASTSSKLIATIAVVAAIGTTSYFSFRVDPKTPTEPAVAEVLELQASESISTEAPIEAEVIEVQADNWQITLAENNTSVAKQSSTANKKTISGDEGKSATNESEFSEATVGNSSSSESQQSQSEEVVQNENETGPTNSANTTTQQSENSEKNEPNPNHSTTEASASNSDLPVQSNFEQVIISDIPKVFTPNNDGKNDVFPIVIEHAKKVDLVIMNTNSQLVFKSELFDIQWNGVDLAGNEVEPGNYVYILKVVDNNNEIVTKKGLITVIK